MKNLTLLFLIALSLFSCKKDSGTSSTDNYLEITINGKNYKADVSGTFGFTDNETCDEKPAYLANVGQVETSDFFFDIYLLHYENVADFQDATTGDFSVKNSFFSTLCNFDVGVELEDNTQDDIETTLFSGGKNTISDIKQVGETSTEINYVVKGSFSCSFRNSSNDKIPVTGSYQLTLNVLK